MQFHCKVAQRNNGIWSVRHDGSEFGKFEVTAATRLEALDKMRNELRHRLEICPCTGELYQDMRIELVETS